MFPFCFVFACVNASFFYKSPLHIESDKTDMQHLWINLLFVAITNEQI